MHRKILGVIPARYASSRFPGKALARIGSKTMLEHVYERVSMARYLTSVVIATDDDRIFAEARRFGAATSGYVVLYDMRGQLLFKGGITAGRGHAVDNAGADAIKSLLRGRSADMNRAPVYGCSLANQCGTGLRDTAL